MGGANRYELGPLIGRGGFGEVYRGSALGAEGFAKPVALKRIPQSLVADSRFVQALVREAKLLVTLQHGNLVNVLDLQQTDDDIFLVLELVDGVDLASLLGAGPRPSLPVAVYIIGEACRGMAHAHERPGGAVVHLDLSPDNLMLTRAGEVKVTDFGIARTEGISERTGVIEGKWTYMSPEQARGERLNQLSDVYSMGAVLYELITGAPPYDGKSAVGLRAALMRGLPPAPLSAVSPEAPAALIEVCARAMAVEPAERFESMRAFGDGLADVAFAQRWRTRPADLGALVDAAAPAAAPAAVDVLAGLGIGAAGGGGTMPQDNLRSSSAPRASTSDAGVTTAPSSSPGLEPASAELSQAGLHEPAFGPMTGKVIETRVVATPIAQTTSASQLAAAPSIEAPARQAAPNIDANTKPAAPDRPASPERPAPLVATPGQPAPLAATPVQPAQRLIATPGQPPPIAATPAQPARRRSYAMPLAIAAVLMAALMAALAWSVRTEQNETIVTSTPAPDSPAAPRAVAPKPAPPKPIAAAPVPTPTPPVKQPARATPPKPRQAKPAPTGRLRLFSEPWAEVYVDGQATNRTTPIDDLALPAGRHRLRLVNPVTGSSKALWVEIPAGQTKLLQVKLEQR